MEREDDVSLVEYSIEDLMLMRDIALAKYDEIIEDWAIELKSISSEKGFDQYTRKGEKQLKKLSKKYTDDLTDAEIVLETVQAELDKRETYNEQQRYMEGGNYYSGSNYSDDEFLRREREKTERIRNIISE